MLYIDKRLPVFSSNLLLKMLNRTGPRPGDRGKQWWICNVWVQSSPQYLVGLDKDTSSKHGDMDSYHLAPSTQSGQGKQKNHAHMLYKDSAVIPNSYLLSFLIAFTLIISFGLPKNLMKRVCRCCCADFPRMPNEIKAVRVK